MLTVGGDSANGRRKVDDDVWTGHRESAIDSDSCGEVELMASGHMDLVCALLTDSFDNPSTEETCPSGDQDPLWPPPIAQRVIFVGVHGADGAPIAYELARGRAAVVVIWSQIHR
jgi:hypothetical protein